MKKLFLLALCLMIMSGVAYASSSIQSSDNAVILGPNMGPQGKTAPTLVVKCYVTDSAILSSHETPNGTTTKGGSVGDVLVWDLNKHDGYCVKYLSTDAASSMGTVNNYVAGVLVTPVSRDTASLSTASGAGTNVGYMAVKGYTQAKIDVSQSNIGEALVPNGGTLSRSFATHRAAGLTTKDLSQDVGILLYKSAADSIYHVVLK